MHLHVLLLGSTGTSTAVSMCSAEAGLAVLQSTQSPGVRHCAAAGAGGSAWQQGRVRPL